MLLARFVGEVGRAGVSIGSRWASGSLIDRFCIWGLLRDLRGSRFLERLAFSDEFGQGVDASLPDGWSGYFARIWT